jgi:hypothetical protein
VEIAELIGVTVGSLQVTCSRLGVSLRRPNFNTGIGPLRREESRSAITLSTLLPTPRVLQSSRSTPLPTELPSCYRDRARESHDSHPQPLQALT